MTLAHHQSTIRCMLLAGTIGSMNAACDRSGFPAAVWDEASHSIMMVPSITDTLQRGGGPILGDPLAIFRGASGRYYAFDRSDKDVKVYASDGSYDRLISQPGKGPGEIEVLWGGAVLRGDTILVYDFADVAVEVFDSEGVFTRSFSLRKDRGPMPATILPVDDSLLLVTAFPIAARGQSLVRLLKPDGSEVTEVFGGTNYLGQSDPVLEQNTYVVAAAGKGWILVGLRGLDSIYAYDYEGRPLAKGQLQGPDGNPLPTFRSLIEANRGNIQRPDGSYVIDSVPALMTAAIIDANHALLQLTSDLRGKHPLPDLTEGGTFVVVHMNPAGGRIRCQVVGDWEWGLLGWDKHAVPLLVRYAGLEFENVVLAQVQALPNS